MFFWVGMICVAGSVFGAGYIIGRDEQAKRQHDCIDHEIECLLNQAKEKALNNKINHEK